MKQGQLIESDTRGEPGALGKSRFDNNQTQTRETQSTNLCQLLLSLPHLKISWLSLRTEEFLKPACEYKMGFPSLPVFDASTHPLPAARELQRKLLPLPEPALWKVSHCAEVCELASNLSSA